ncbi:membrane protein [Marinomonas sp. SBI22]|uniref:DMT family transporter n=1 Tax=unclassified Marinomonas TaxID=196814 RepID=UPI0007AF16CD|nr:MULTISPECIES: DMT family transporter [unclassified Marinomonas]KZM43710.1 membrane protein [Marinomonas sp. SBI22]KZM47272.1 membrane protein [Marinomonas sp. SBI8L]
MMKGVSSLLVWAWLMASSFVVSGNMEAFASPIATTAFRFVLALVLISGLLLANWQRAGINRTQALSDLFVSRILCLQYVLISGALVGFFIGLFVALKYTTPLKTSVLYTLVPLMGVFIAKLWLGERLNGIKLLGFILGSIAACLVLFNSQNDINSDVAELGLLNWNRGDLIFLAACVLLAIHVVSVQKWGRKLAPLSGAFMIMLFGTLWLIPIALIWGELDKLRWLAKGFWLNGLYLTVFATLFTFILQQHLVASVGANRLLAFSYSIPVWVALYSAFANNVLDKLFNLGFMLGLGLLWLAFVLIEVEPSQESRNKENMNKQVPEKA